MPDLEKKPMISTTTAVRFEQNPNWGGNLLEITHEKDINWGDHVTFRALYPNDMEFVKKRNPLLIRLTVIVEKAWEALLGSLSLILLAGAGFGATLFVLAFLLYLLGVFAGIDIIVVKGGHDA